MSDCLSSPTTLSPNEKLLLLITILNTVKVSIAPMASLNADSVITVCATLARIFICLNTGTKVAGSVDAMVAPSNSAIIHGKPKNTCAAQAEITAVMSTPMVEIISNVGHTLRNTLSLTLAPPSNKM